MTAEGPHAPGYDRLHYRSMTGPASLQNSLPIRDGAWGYITMHTSVRTTFTTPAKHGFRRFLRRRCIALERAMNRALEPIWFENAQMLDDCTKSSGRSRCVELALNV